MSGVSKPARVSIPLTTRYWRDAEKGVLTMQRCNDCGRAQLYPRALCRHCWSDDLSWVRGSGAGTVWTFTVAYVPGHPAWVEEAPYVLAVVELDEGPRMTTNIVGCAPDEVYVGQRVRLDPAPPADGQPPLRFVPA